MRQFVSDVEEEDGTTIADITKKTSDLFNTPIIYRKQRPFKLLTNPSKVRVVTPDAKKAAISALLT